MDRARKKVLLPEAFSDLQQRRREEFLSRSKAARSDALWRARTAALGEIGSEPGNDGEAGNAVADDDDVPMERRQVRRPSHHNPRIEKYYSSLLMVHEWLVDVPPGLGPSWRVIPRPAGKRCLLVASGGRTVTRLKSGVVLHTFPSALANGSIKTRKPPTVYTMLDTIFDELLETYFVLDALSWNGVQLCSCSFDARVAWVHSQFSASAASAVEPFAGHRFRMRLCEVHVCDSQGLQAAYSQPRDYECDGLLFVHKDSPYVMQANPFVLHWKDAATSRYPIDTDVEGNVSERQRVVLRCRDDGSLVTGDDPAVSIGRLPEAVLTVDLRGRLKGGMLMRFEVGSSGFQVQPGGGYTADLHWIEVVKSRRRQADILSHMLFQWGLRNGAINAEVIRSVVDNADSGVECEHLDMSDRTGEIEGSVP